MIRHIGYKKNKEKRDKSAYKGRNSDLTLGNQPGVCFVEIFKTVRQDYSTEVKVTF